MQIEKQLQLQVVTNEVMRLEYSYENFKKLQELVIETTRLQLVQAETFVNAMKAEFVLH